MKISEPAAPASPRNFTAPPGPAQRREPGAPAAEQADEGGEDEAHCGADRAGAPGHRAGRPHALADRFRSEADEADVLPGGEPGPDADLELLGAPRDRQPEDLVRPSVDGVDDLLAGFHRYAVDRHHGVSRAEPGLLRRPAGHQLAAARARAPRDAGGPRPAAGHHAP